MVVMWLQSMPLSVRSGLTSSRRLIKGPARVYASYPSARAKKRTQGFHDFISTAIKMVEAVGDWQEGQLNNSNMVLRHAIVWLSCRNPKQNWEGSRRMLAVQYRYTYRHFAATMEVDPGGILCITPTSYAV